MKEKISGTKVAVATIAAVVALLMLVPSLPIFLVAPLERLDRRLLGSVGSRVWGFFHGAAAAAENVRLRREVALLTLEREDGLRLQAENERLRTALGYISHRTDRWLAAGVLSSGGGAASVGRTLRIDRGASDGVKRGMPVLVPEGLVGRVTSVQSRSSVVTLLTDPGLSVSCLTESNDGAVLHGIVSGGSNELLSFSRISGDREVPVRTRIVTSGLGGVYPRGISVGTLLRLTRNANGLLDVGEIIPSVDFNSLEEVFVRCEEE